MNLLRPSTRVFRVVLTAAFAAALAACASAPVVPNAGGVAPVPQVVARAKTCVQPSNTYLFGGSCDSVLLRPQGAKLFLTHYHGIVVLMKFGARKHVTKSTPILAADATGNGDIQPLGGTPFPSYTGAAGTPIVYLKVVNGGKAAKFTSTPSINITYPAKLPGSTCTLSVLTSSGWLDTPLTTAVTGHAVRFPSVPLGAGFTIPAGAYYIVASCK
ncbi:MAG: hypothetical protein JO029_06450 [Candidatus Eremiobacteraeota bacterium]|nr:hypothetical protein [Candidatus Eremiobacteraeota bacterium]